MLDLGLPSLKLQPHSVKLKRIQAKITRDSTNKINVHYEIFFLNLIRILQIAL